MHTQQSFDSARISRSFSRNEQKRPNYVPRSIPDELKAINKGAFDVSNKIFSSKRPDEDNTKICGRHDLCTGCEVHLMFQQDSHDPYQTNHTWDITQKHNSNQRTQQLA